MRLELPYGIGRWQEDLPDLEEATWLEPAGVVEPIPDIHEAVADALSTPLGTERLQALVTPEDTVAIVISDITRPSPTRAFLDGLARELDVAGVPPHQVTVIVGTGTHRASTTSELATMLGGEHLQHFRVLVHDCHDTSNLAYLGETPRGVPLYVNRAVTEASVRILTGAITPHHLCGFSGGRKAMLPGVAGLETVAKHHSFPIRTEVPALGQIQGNPAHEEALAAAKTVGVDFVLNAVPNPRGSGFLGVVAGELEQAHETGAHLCFRACQVPFYERYELTICSPGGHPRDLNLHQAQKALTVAEMVTRPGGAIVLVAECTEGMGSPFAKWLQESTPREVLASFQRTGWSEASGKAMMFARALCKHPLFSVSSLDEDALSSIHFRKVDSISDAWRRLCAEKGAALRTAIIPRAAGLIPALSAAEAAVNLSPSCQEETSK